MKLEENKDIDNLFKSAIEPFAMEPTDKVWTSLEKGLADKGAGGTAVKGGYGIKLLSIVTAVLLISFGTYKLLVPADSAVKQNEVASTPAAAVKTSAPGNSSAMDARVKEFFGSSQEKGSKAGSSSNAAALAGINTSDVNSNEDKVSSSTVAKSTVKNEDHLSSPSSVAFTNNNTGKQLTAASSSASANKDALTPNERTARSSSASANSPTPGLEQRSSPWNPALAIAGTMNQGGDADINTNPENAAASELQKKENAGEGVKPETLQSSSQSGESKEAAQTNQPAANADGGTSKQAPNGNVPAESHSDAASENKTPAQDFPLVLNNSKTESDKVEDAPASLKGTEATADATSTGPLTNINASKGIMRRLSVDAFYAPEIANRNYDLTSGSSATKTTEKFNYSFNTGVLFRMDLNSHFSVSLGCTYSVLDYLNTVTTSYTVPQPDSTGRPQQGGGWHIPHGDHEGQGHGGHGGQGGHEDDEDSAFSHQFHDPDFFNHYFPTDDDNNINYNNSCGSVHLHGSPTINLTSPSTHPGDVVYFVTNTNLTLKYINIPLTIRYKLPAKRLDYYVNAGISMDILISQLATVNIADSYTETTGEIDGLRKTSYSYLFGLGVQYHLSGRWGLFAEPSVRGSITPVNDNASDEFRPYYLGVKTGVSFHF